jgi:choline dehydrogenase-like flavoprotein
MGRLRDTLVDLLGNTALDRFDVCVIGSGAGGATAAHALTAAGKNVLVLEAGHNPFPGLDLPGAEIPPPLHSNDELKYAVRGWLDSPGLLDPRTFRTDARQNARIRADVQSLPKAVGGAFQHADCKTPRFNVVDFALRSHVEAKLGATPGLAVPGFGADAASAHFADWPLSYAELEPYYVEAEQLYGVAGTTDNPYASWRSAPYPMPPGNPMYHSLLLADGARATPFLDGFLTPHTYPAAINSRPYDGRPACNDCGPCSGFGCPIHAKGSPAVTALRKALLTGRCQVRYNARALWLANRGGHVGGVLYVDDLGVNHFAEADAYVLAASPIESARLCLFSRTPAGGALGNASDQVGRNLMFHLQTIVSGFVPQRVHGQRGRAVTHGISDCRGVEPGGESVRVYDVDGAPGVFLGGVVEFGCSQGLAITEDAGVIAFDLAQAGAALRFGLGLKNALRDGALTQHLVSVIMQAEDAPQQTNRVDLDPVVKDVWGYPVPRITYKPHAFEIETRKFYLPILRALLENAGATNVFLAPCDTLLRNPPTSSHIMGTLRMGPDPATSVTNAAGRFHDVENLYACDGSVFPTSSGWNPTLTIIANALRIARGIAAAASG